MIEAGGKPWNEKRVYFNSKEDVAKLFNYEVVDRVCGCCSEGFDGMIRGGKTKSYFDIKSETFYADSGDVANAFRTVSNKVRRV